MVMVFLFSTSLSAKTFVLYSPSGGDFQLPTVQNKKINTKELRGSNIALVFGFAHCASVCPLILRRLKETLALLSPAERDHTKVLFISVDNERDTLKSLNTFVTGFDPHFLSGTTIDKNLKTILHQFGARYHRFKTKNDSLLVDHTSDIYIINKKGIWANTLKAESTPEEMIKALRNSDQIQNISERFPASLSLELVGSDHDCDLAVRDCKIKVLEESFLISVSNRPIQTLRPFAVLVTSLSANHKLNPIEVDFDGVNLSMGYIRPQFSNSTPSQSLANVTLPYCELAKMNWRLTFVFKNANNRSLAAQLKLSSME